MTNKLISRKKTLLANRVSEMDFIKRSWLAEKVLIFKKSVKNAHIKKEDHFVLPEIGRASCRERV